MDNKRQSMLLLEKTLTILLLCVAGLGLAHCVTPQVPTEPPPRAVSEVPQEECQFAASSWHGITPDRTLESEIEPILGQPNNVVHYLDGISAYHYYPRNNRSSFFTVIVKDGIVQKTAEVLVPESGSNTLFETLVQMGCKLVMLERQRISPHPVYAFPEQGVAFEIVDEQSVQVEQHFVPTSATDYLAQRTTVDLRLDTELNRIHLLELLDIKPGSTTQADVDGMLQAGSTINGVHTLRKSSGQSHGGLPQLQLNLCRVGMCVDPLKQEAQIAFQDGIVFTMELRVVSTAPSPYGNYADLGPSAYEIYSLGDALRDYGDPVLAFVAESEGQPIELRLVYPREGRQVTISAATSETHTRCLMLNSAVRQILYFAPLSEEEFRSQSAILWHNDLPAMHDHREIPWPGIAQFSEQDGLTQCLQP